MSQPASAASPEGTDATDLDATAGVLVVGGGPAGAAAAHRLASAGHRVVVVERQRYPRPKTCGDALSPLAVAELAQMGIGADELVGFHRVEGVRFVGHDRVLEVPWPAHPTLPAHGVVARRDLLDQLVIERAASAGAVVLDGHDAVEPIVERGFVRGAVVRDGDGRTRELRARFTVVADGANSRFGRALGTYRERSWPYATAIRGYWASPRHDAPVLEAIVDVTHRDSGPITGYGWVFPLGDGTVNVGVGVVSTSRDFRSVNTTHLLERLAERVAGRWELDPGAPLAPPVSGRIPLGGSVGPAAGPRHLVIGDAAGSGNPMTGAGIEYAYATGRMAGAVLDEALGDGTAAALQRYPKLLESTYGSYFKVGRLVDRFAGRPAVVDRLSRRLVRSERLAAATLRFATNELRPDRTGVPEAAFALARAISRVAPAS